MAVNIYTEVVLAHGVSMFDSSVFVVVFVDCSPKWFICSEVESCTSSELLPSSVLLVEHAGSLCAGVSSLSFEPCLAFELLACEVVYDGANGTVFVDFVFVNNELFTNVLLEWMCFLNEDNRSLRNFLRSFCVVLAGLVDLGQSVVLLSVLVSFGSLLLLVGVSLSPSTP